MSRMRNSSKGGWGSVLMVLVVLAFAGGTEVWALPTFSGAEGAGANSTGGRGGDVYHVTSLLDDPCGTVAGSLRYGVNHTPSSGRTIVFDISGTITLSTRLNVYKNNLTIAGQTAPGNGIQIAGEGIQVRGTNVVLQQFHVRPGYKDPNNTRDAIWVYDTSRDVMVDHISASWSDDETISVTGDSDRVSVQYCIISECLNYQGHGYGSIISMPTASFHHNLYALNKSRNPATGNNGGVLDFRNNVMYDWSYRSGYDDPGNAGNLNFVNNYYKYGLDTPAGTRMLIFGHTSTATRMYASGNYVYGYPAVTADNWEGNNGYNNNGGMLYGSGVSEAIVRVNTPFAAAPVYTQTAEDAYNNVLANVGAFAWNRDSVDANIVAKVQTGTGHIINYETDVGGYPTYAQISRDANFDTDHDGMSNAWELAHGLDPNVANNNGDIDNDGYTNLEEYLMDLAPIAPPKTIVWAGGSAGRYELIGNWDIPWQPTVRDPVEIDSGKATVAYINQEAGTLWVANTTGGSAELAVTAGSLSIGNALYVGSADNSAGTATISGGAMRVGGTFTNWSGGSAITGGGTVALGSGSVARGVLNITGGSLIAAGPIVMAGGSASTAQLYVAKAANVQVGGLLINSGSGRSTQVSMELDANGNSLISSSGAVGLAGALNVQSLSNYRPNQGDAFTLITSTSSLSGDFSSLTSNLVNTDPNRNVMGLLIRDANASDPNLKYWSAFRGEVDANAYVLTFQGAMAGDATADNTVDGTDFGSLARNYGQSGKIWTDGDFNGDGVVDGTDFGALARNWGLTGLSPEAAPLDAPIPEPATLMLLAAGGLSLIRRKSR